MPPPKSPISPPLTIQVRDRPASAALEAAAELMQTNPKLAAKHSLRSLASAVSTS